MKKIVKVRTIELVKENLDEIGITLPLTEESFTDSILKLLDYFTQWETSLSMDMDDGRTVDSSLVRDVSNAVDDFNVATEDRETIDMDSLNERLLGRM